MTTISNNFSYNRNIIPNASTYNPLKKHRFLKGIAEGGLSRFILLEACVEAGRTYNAYKRGGFHEARERITEEFTAAVFWLGGVQFFNAIIDQIGKRVLKLNDVDFACGNDSVRNPLKNFVFEHGGKDIEAFKNKITKFKGIKVITSVLLANAMIGFVVPKINQAITRAYYRNDNKKADSNPKAHIDKFMKNENTISFKSGALFNIANKLETDTTWQLLSQDVGTAGGRTISARNNDERREILIRDLGSIFFYMFNMPLINMALNKIEQDGRSTRTDSMNAAYLKDVIVAQMKDHLKTNKISPENLEKLLLGAGNVLDNDNFRNLLNETFKDNAMNLDEIITKIPEFCEKLGVEDVGNYKLLAERMSELQPKLEGKALITKDQVVKLFNGGLLNDPEFLKNVYSLNYGVENNLPNFLNPFKFIHNNSVEKFNDKSIERVDGDLRYFATQIIEKAKKSGYEITEEILEKAVKKNFRFNLLNWGTGFGVSALFLSTLIPKIQYWITQKRTGSNEFPGTKEFRQE